MTVPPHRIADYMHDDVHRISLRTSSGAPCCEIDRDQLVALVATKTVVGVPRGKRLLYVQLTVPPDVAFRGLGEGKHGNPQKLTYEEHFNRAAPVTLLKLHSASSTYTRCVRATVAGGVSSNGTFRVWREDEQFARRSAEPAARPGKGPLRPPMARSK
jgi:hypothetical protein